MLNTKKGQRLIKYIPDYVVFDLETTGISPSYDEVIEISGLKVREGRIVDEYNTLVNPDRFIPYSATQINGITNEMVADAPPFAEVLMEFLEFAGNDVLVGHNIHCFDMKFIYRDTKRFFMKVPDNDYIDTLSLARRCLPQLSRHRLVDLAAHYGISANGAHRAINDCKMNQQVFENMAKDLEEAEKNNIDLKICPQCGEVMQKRRGRFGMFWGCGGYPACRHTERI